MKKIYDGSGTLISNTESWCRHRDCVHHPAKKSLFYRLKVCLLCKHFVHKDMYKVKNLREM